MITQVRVDENDPAFQTPTKPIGKFVSAEQAKKMEKDFNYVMKEDTGRGYRRVVASPKPVVYTKEEHFAAGSMLIKVISS